jgi:serine protease inhibitor
MLHCRNRIPALHIVVLSPECEGRAHKKTSALSQPTNPADIYGPIVAANNRFAVNFFKAEYADKSGDNILTAPASLSYAFALLLNGAASPAWEQISDVFDVRNIPLDQINLGSATLRALRKPHLVPKVSSKQPFGFSGVVGADGRTFQPYAMAGALWFPKGAFAQSFLSANARSYGYTVFPGRPTTAMINRWASLQTHGKLQRIVQNVGQDDFALATVVDFKSKWVWPFSVAETHAGEFTLLSGAKKTVRMMPKHNPEFQYFKGENFQSVKLGFYDAAMVVVLPDEDSSLRAVVDALTIENWQSWSGQFGSRDGYLELPQFEIRQQTDSMNVLEKMGLTLPFSNMRTFAPMIGPVGGKLTRVQEGASMKVGETGAEILSYGVIGGVVGGICGNCPPPPPPFHMIVNRPFFFWIVDTRTNQTLYMGSVVEP